MLHSRNPTTTARLAFGVAACLALAGCSDDPSTDDAAKDGGATEEETTGEGSGSGDDGGDGADGSGEDGAAWTAPEGGVVELSTEDEITLVADYYPVDTQGAPAVVLLHMIPPSWDRASWPAEFIAELNGQGWAVLVPDRRGAGDSEGTAREAYTGPNGKYDAAACVDRLVADGYGAFAIIGASNGTTTTLDYTLWAGSEGKPVPAALGFMTGGSYTETNRVMDTLGGDIPAVFTFSTEERAWSVAQQAFGHSSWTFHEYARGDHGTLMFAAAPEVTSDLVTFLAASFGG